MDETRLEKLCRGFSCPQESWDEKFLQLIAVGYARELVTRFIARYGRRLERQGLLALFEAWTGKANSFDSVWDPAFGQIRQALLPHGSSHCDRSAAGLALRLHECGIGGEWRLRFERPARLRMGPWLLPRADQMTVQADKKKILIETSLAGSKTTKVFWRHDGSWKADGAQQFPQVAAEKHKIMLLFADALEGMEFEQIGPVAQRRRQNAIVAPVQRAITLLRSHAPIYLSWVDRVVRSIVPVKSSGSLMQSGTEAGYPGIVQMSLRGPSFGLAELLVHEGTHLYMNLLCQLGELDDGSDTKLYYSPVRGTDRPIRWILIAYHAFANVLLLYRTFLAGGFDSNRYCSRNEKTLVSQLKQLESALRTSRALTPLGRALWKPLAAQIG